jgi:hypothetical protein
MNCLLDTDCYWNTNTSTCETSCAAYSTPSMCASHANCVWNGTSSQCTVKPCSYYTVSACEQDPNCRWVIKDDVAQCELNPCPPATPPVACNALPNCQYNNYTASCEMKPCSYPSRAICATDHTCIWRSTTQTCELIPQDQCVYSDWSAWSACSNPCLGGTQTRTRVVIRPSPDGNPCLDTQETAVCDNSPCDCTTITSSFVCVNSPGCTYIDGACHNNPNYCAQQVDEQACVSANCYWVASVGQCTNP